MNQTIITVTAIDRDIGVHANIIYSLANYTYGDINSNDNNNNNINNNNRMHPFSINPDTGDLLLVEALDYEKQVCHLPSSMSYHILIQLKF